MTRPKGTRVVRCAGPECERRFETMRLNGPNARRFCSAPCRDRYHNATKRRLMDLGKQAMADGAYS